MLSASLNKSFPSFLPCCSSGSKRIIIISSKLCLFLGFVSFDNPGFVVVEVAVELLSRIMAVELVNSVCF